MSRASLKICLVDMNNGLPNQAIRCFKQLIAALQERARAANPGLEVAVTHVQPRNLGELPPHDADLVLSSGGPGAPTDGWDEPWAAGYRGFLDHVADTNARGGGPSVLAVCHSFQLAVMHFGVATMQARAQRKFGIMPVYMTEAGRHSALLGPFGDRLFAFENRGFEAVGLDEKRLAQCGGELWARESRDGVSKGRAVMALKLAPGIEAVQFHPEADLDGVLAWIRKPEMEAAFKQAFGDETYGQMMDTLEDPTRVLRTHNLLIPGWLDREFNGLARSRGWGTLVAAA